MATLRDTVNRLSVRLGMAAQGVVQQGQRPILEDFVRSAQAQLLQQFGDQLLHVVNQSLSTVANQTLYDYPSECDPNRILGVYVSISGQWISLVQGIQQGMRGYLPSGFPERYDVRDKMELWPKPSGVYGLAMEYYRREAPLQDFDDALAIDDELCFLHALVNAKAHYNQQDAQLYGAQLATMLGKVRASQHGTRRYFFGDSGRSRSIYSVAPDFSSQTT